MNIIIREPITLECGQLFLRHVIYRLHSIAVDYNSKGVAALIINPQIVVLDGNGIDALLDLIAQHHCDVKNGVTLMRESSGYYTLQVYSD